MENENMMNEEEKINDDTLESYFYTNTSIHITLKRIDNRTGKHCWLNGTLKGRITPRTWNFDEEKLGEIRLSISEIMPNGIVVRENRQ